MITAVSDGVATSLLLLAILMIVGIAGQSCEELVVITPCLQPKGDTNPASTCNFADRSTVQGLPMNFQTARSGASFSNASATYCQDGSGMAPTISAFDTTKWTHLGVISSFSSFSSAKWAEEVTIIATLANGVQIPIGNIVPRANALVAGTPTLTKPSETNHGAPWNGAAVCDDTVSYQTFPVSHVVANNIEKITFIGGGGSFKLYGMTGYTCAATDNIGAASPMRSFAIFQSVKRDPQATAGFTDNSPTTTWAECAGRCLDTGNCAAYVHTGTMCSILTSLDLVAPESTNNVEQWSNDAVLGVKAVDSAQTLGYAAKPNSTANEDTLASKMSQSLRFASATTTTLVLWTSGDSNIYWHEFEVNSASEIAVAVGNTNMDENGVTVVVGGARVQRCGSAALTYSGNLRESLAGPFDTPVPTPTNETCAEVVMCPTMSFPNALAATTVKVFFRKTPVSSACRAVDNLGSLVVVHIGGSTDANYVIGAKYFYTRDETTQSSDADFTAAVQDHHATTTGITEHRAYRLGSGSDARQLYSFAADRSVAPNWRWYTSDRQLRSSSVYCELRTPIGYRVVNNNIGSDQRNCSTFDSIYAMAAACEGDQLCFGYTTEVVNTTEYPRCLLYSTTPSPNTNDNYTVFYKIHRDTDFQCSFPLLTARYATVLVSAALTNAVYQIYADNTLIGSCSPTVTTSGDVCNTLVPCYAGSVDIRANIKVRPVFTGPPVQHCSRSPMIAKVTFDPDQVGFVPVGTCLATASDPSSCTSRAALTGDCASARALSPIAVPATFCPVSSRVSSFGVTSTNPIYNILAVLDLSGVQAAAQVSAMQQVTAVLSDGVHVPLGYVYLTNSQTRFVSVASSPQNASSLCSDAALQSTLPFANLAGIAVPAFAAEKVSAVTFSGSGLSVITAVVSSAASPTCQVYPLPQKTTNDMFMYTMPGLRFESPTYSTPTASDWADCAEQCAEDSNCGAYSFTSGSCSLKRGGGRTAVPTDFNPGTKPYVSGIRRDAAQKTRPAVLPGVTAATHVNNLAKTILGAQGVRIPIVFAISPNAIRKELAVSVPSAGNIRLYAGQTALAGEAFIGTNSAPLGFAQTCGNFYVPFDGASSGVDNSCNTLRGCPSNVRPDSPFTMFHATMHSPATTTCASPFWGVLDLDMNSEAVAAAATPGVQYYHTATTSSAVDQRESFVRGQTNPVVGLMTSVTVAGQETDVALMQPPTASATVLGQTNKGTFCELRHRYLYTVVANTVGAATAEYSCNSFADVPTATLACNGDPSCKGFSIDTNSAPLCLVTTTAGSRGSTLGSSLMVKQEVSECVVETQSAGRLTVDVPALGLHQGSGNSVEIFMNGVLLKKCGTDRPFATGYHTTATPSCTTYLRCFNDFIDVKGSLVVKFSSINYDEVCEFSNAALINLEPTVQQSAVPLSALAQLNQLRTVRVPDSAGKVDVSLRQSGVSRVGVMVKQDRFSCVGVNCVQPYVLNVSIAGVDFGLCGGQSDFYEARGQSGACSTYYFCGTISGGKVQAREASANERITVQIVNDQTLQSSGGVCDAAFVAHVFTDGLLLPSQASFSSMRTFYGLDFNSTADGLAATNTTGKLITVVNGQLSTINMTGTPVVFNQQFPVRIGTDATVTKNMVLFDTPDVVESYKSIENGTVVCAIDGIVDGQILPLCSTVVMQNRIRVRVAQTAFSAVSQTVTIRIGNETTVCGGDNSFFGFSGVVNDCNAYYTCMDQEVTPGSRVELEFSADVLSGTTCSPAGVALIESFYQAPIVPVDCSLTPDTPFECQVIGKCLTRAEICDRNADCPDSSDESRCSGWNFVIADAVPTCTPLATEAVVSASTAESRCIQLAVLLKGTSFVVNSTTCSVYTCLDFSSPSLQFLDTTPAPSSADGNVTVAPSGDSQSSASTASTRLFIFTSDPSVFQYCTPSLHCNNNGDVQSTATPCTCNCFSQYIGSRCESQRDISLVNQLLVIVNAEATLNNTMRNRMRAALLDELPAGYQVVIESVETTGTNGDRAVRLTIADGAGITASSSVLQELMTPAAQARYIAKVEAYGVRYLTATAVVGNVNEFLCRPTTLATVADRTCEDRGAVSIANSRLVTLTVPGITFVNDNQFATIRLYSQSVDAGNSSRRQTVAPTETIVCSRSDFVSSTGTGTGACATNNRCIKPINGSIPIVNVSVEVSQNFNPTGVLCSGFPLDMTIKIEGDLTLPDETGSSEPSTATTYSAIFLYTAIALGAVGLLCGCMLIAWFRMREKFEAVKYAGPLFGAGCFFFLLFSVCIFAYYLDTAENTYTHELIIEEYRDPLCEDSEFSYIPHRISFVPIDGNCNQVASIGLPEGIRYISAETSSNKSGVYSLRIGGTLESCKKANVVRVYGRQCLDEQGVYQFKTGLERHYVKLHSLPKAIAQARLGVITQLNPPVNLNSIITVIPLTTVFEENRDFQFRIGAKASRVFNWYNPFPTDSARLHFGVYRPEDVPVAIAAQSNPPERVIYRNEITTRATLFERSKDHNISTTPRRVEDNTNFSDIGTFFNGYQTTQQYPGVEAYRSAQRYAGVIGREPDVGKSDAFTISFWLNANGDTRGLVFAVTDNWVETATGASPIADRLMNIIENTDKTVSWYSSDWQVYSGVYVNGLAKSLHFVYASPLFGVQNIRWDTEFIGVDRLFNGGWHYVSIVVQNGADGKDEAKLYVDGETSLDEGWAKCLDHLVNPINALSPGQRLRVFNQRQEEVETDGLLLVGYLNGGVYDLTFELTELDAEEIIANGASGMELYNKIAVSESITLGVVTLMFAAVIILYSAYQGWTFYWGLNLDDDDDLDNPRATEAGQGAQGGMQSSSASSVQFWQFVQPVAFVLQSMSMYFQGWTWPAGFRNAFGGFFGFMSFDLLIVWPDLPPLTWPAIQFILATVLLFALLHFAIRDNDRHGNVIQHYRETQRARKQAKKGQEMTELQVQDAVKPTYKWVIHTKSGAVDASEEQSEMMERTLMDLMTSRHRREANMRLHTKKLIDMGDLGLGILMYERINGKVRIAFRASDKAPSEDKDADQITLTETVIEQVCENIECPEHGKRLLPDDLMTTTCVHSDNPFYRSMACPRNCIMYRCPVEFCEYGVCEYCYNGGTISGALSGALAKVQEIRKHGAIGTLGTAVVLLAGIIYMPVILNAIMIITCHPTFQCVFPSCTQDPDMLYIISALLAGLVVVFILVGFIVIQTWLLTKRHRSLVKVLPLQKIHRRFNCWILPQNFVHRDNYIDYLKIDNSMLKSLYEPFDFSFFWFSPFMLFVKSLLVIVTVVPEPDSLTQLSIATAIEVIFAMMLIGISPYKNVYVEALARLGSFHQLILLGLMSLHRVDKRNNPNENGYTNQMIAATVIYLVIVFALLIAVVIVPSVKKCYAAYRRKKDEEENVNQTDIYDIGFWGNPHSRGNEEL